MAISGGQDMLKFAFSDILRGQILSWQIRKVFKQSDINSEA